MRWRGRRWRGEEFNNGSQCDGQSDNQVSEDSVVPIKLNISGKDACLAPHKGHEFCPLCYSIFIRLTKSVIVLFRKFINSEFALGEVTKHSVKVWGFELLYKSEDCLFCFVHSKLTLYTMCHGIVPWTNCTQIFFPTITKDFDPRKDM